MYIHHIKQKRSILKNYAKPPIPDGYKHVCGEWNNGFVIEREADGSQFVWVPAGSLDKSEQKFESESIKKYGGFYISRFNISRNEEGKLQSIQGKEPLINTAYHYTIRIAEGMEDGKDVQSHLTYDGEYELILQWFIDSHSASYDELYVDSSCIGNYRNSENESDKPAKTGSCEEWCINNIYDFAGNVREWTMESDTYSARRGGSFCDSGRINTAAFRYGSSPLTGFGVVVGFRVVLDIK